MGVKNLHYTIRRDALGGRTPWSAVGPLADFQREHDRQQRQADEGVGRGPGVRPPLFEAGTEPGAGELPVAF
jgi:hypothetical protein